ncbi:uncharacterized protein LOC108677835 [Hyalella azteca]|uniref:Uncharacterized protein LOC108677835 n=1 Tax=Hyalella azteca TaxID=294128 RepID=A0A8B7P6V8_HYAAZ|nr:uncharacterized protein LOC108677835 [Hyalella azteca]
MQLLTLTIGVLCFVGSTAITLEEVMAGSPVTAERVVRDLLEYYKQEDPLGIPGLEVKDPFFLDKTISVSVLSLHGIEVAGLSKFKLQYVNVNASSLTATVLLRIPWLQVISVYEYSTYWSGTRGDMNLTFTEFDIKISAELGSDNNAKLIVTKLAVDITKESFIPILTNTTLDLDLIVSAADSFFDTLVSSAVGSRVSTATDKINERLGARLGDKRFPAGIPPIDLLVAGIKQDLRQKMDPLKIGHKIVQLPAGLSLNASNISVAGLSTVHRAGEVSLQLIDDRLLLVLQLGCQAVSVHADVEVSSMVLPSMSSSLKFTLDSLSIWVEAQQSADVRHPPQLRRIQITLGNFRLVGSGESSFSYLLEAAVNTLPNALRGTISSAIQPTLHKIIQQRLYSLDIEELIEKRLAARAARRD